MIGPVVGIAASLAGMTWEEKRAELARLDRSIARYERMNTMTERQRQNMNARYHDRYIIRRYGGNPGNLPVYDD